ncbi:hypothetical protein QBC47DRAFT_54415 [Echria macrotheca]|uniref:Secreted protein n=1 Tax=Echria macrotheca TaxID=438768 RepID=A0AAJ0B7T6_9PEZI|nr:hypothetical protein QBC47DRAFT_54415 [Echria macrotheca]
MCWIYFLCISTNLRATSSGVSPDLVATSRLAPCLTSDMVASQLQRATASWSAVQPSASWMQGSAPASRRIMTSTLVPEKQARNNAVWPFLLAYLGKRLDGLGVVSCRKVFS